MYKHVIHIYIYIYYGELTVLAFYCPSNNRLTAMIATAISIAWFKPYKSY